MCWLELVSGRVSCLPAGGNEILDSLQALLVNNILQSAALNWARRRQSSLTLRGISVSHISERRRSWRRKNPIRPEISFPASLDSTIKEDQTAAPPLCKFQCGLRFLTAVLRRHLAGKEFILVYLFFVYVKLREYKSNGMSGTEINHASQN